MSTPLRGYPELVGDHPLMRSLAEMIRRAAPSRTPVLVQGPTGTGKELVAAALHGLSERRGPLVAVNVAALPESLAESELFGAERGAYTSAVRERRGLVESAAEGTLYLDEAGDLSPELQAKLLRVLETGAVRRVGGTEDRRVSFRLVLSTQRPAAELVGAGRWRADFYYRVAGIELSVPPLVERMSDLPLLVNHFLRQAGLPPLRLQADDPAFAHSWPGNVRELRRAVERAVFLAAGEPVRAEHLHAALASSPAAAGVPGAATARSRRLRDVERAHIEVVLHEVGGHTRAAAEILGLSVHQLYRRFVRLGITPPRQRTAPAQS